MSSSRVVTTICVAAALVAVSRFVAQPRKSAAPAAAERVQAAAQPAASSTNSAPQAEIATTVAFTEGPAVDRDGSVYFTDIINERIMKLGADGVLSTYRERSNAANGLLIDLQGRLVACEGGLFERPGVKRQGTPRLTRTDLKSGKIETIASGYEGKPFSAPNDVTIDSKGRLYFTYSSGTVFPAGAEKSCKDVR